MSVCLGMSLCAQTASSPPGQSTYVIHQRVEEVLLYCTVTDRKGELVTDLPRTAFAVSEDKHPVVISHFSQEDVPVSLPLILDGSGSMKTKRSAVQGAALDLIKASNPEDETSITNFADAAYLDQELTNDVTKLQTALNGAKTVSGGTALFDTVTSAADHLSRNAHHSKQVMVVITDGNDNASASNLAATIRRVQRTDGPAIYAIGLLYDVPGSDASRARKELIALAEQTGGLCFFPSSLDDVDKIAMQVAKDIRNQYTLAFHPLDSTTKDDYHTVLVRASAAGARGLTVRTRAGFKRSVPE